MSTEMRRAVLEGIAESDEATGHERLRALELLAELDRREVPPMPEAPPWRETDREKLHRTFELLLQAGAFHEWLNAEAARLTAARLRDEFHIADEPETAADEPEDEEEAGGPPDTSEATNEADSAPDEPSPLEWYPGVAALRRWSDSPEPPRLLDRFRPRNQ